MTFKVDLVVTLAAAGADGTSVSVPSPSGLAAGKTRFAVLDATGAQLQTADIDGLETTFTGLPDGTFTATAQMLDTAGTPILDAVSASFVDGVATTPTAATVVPFASLSATVTAE